MAFFVVEIIDTKIYIYIYSRCFRVICYRDVTDWGWKWKMLVWILVIVMFLDYC